MTRRATFVRRCRRIARLGLVALRLLATLASLLLLGALVVAWVRGHRATESLYIVRDALDHHEWRSHWCLLGLGRGDVAILLGSDRAPAADARDAGAPDGVVWWKGRSLDDTGEAPATMLDTYDSQLRSIKPPNQAWHWRGGGLLLARTRGTGPSFGSWGQDVPDAHVQTLIMILPCWLLALLLTLLPAQRLYAFLLRRRHRPKPRHNPQIP